METDLAYLYIYILKEKAMPVKVTYYDNSGSVRIVLKRMKPAPWWEVNRFSVMVTLKAM